MSQVARKNVVTKKLNDGNYRFFIQAFKAELCTKDDPRKRRAYDSKTKFTITNKVYSKVKLRKYKLCSEIQISNLLPCE
jgi:hypothetical protein